jgi:hypothetical protein
MDRDLTKAGQTVLCGNMPARNGWRRMKGIACKQAPTVKDTMGPFVESSQHAQIKTPNSIEPGAYCNDQKI